jgi:hypothetical protein
LLEPVTTDQSDINTQLNTEVLLTSDCELNGSINRASGQGAKFTLMLAMLDQNPIHRPQLEKPRDLNQTPKVETEQSYYRNCPLSAKESYWQTSQHTNQLIHSGQLDSAHLWLAMHPEPLSQHNRRLEIDEEVIANCSLNTQNRMQQGKNNTMEVDETGLYDILQGLAPVSA